LITLLSSLESIKVIRAKNSEYRFWCIICHDEKETRHKSKCFHEINSLERHLAKCHADDTKYKAVKKLVKNLKKALEMGVL